MDFWTQINNGGGTMPKKPQEMIPVPNTQHELRVQTFCNMIDEWLDSQEKAKEYYEFEFKENSVDFG